VFVNHLFLTQSFFVKGTGFNHVSWSISTEFYTYLIFGLILVYLRQLRTLSFVAIILFSGLYLRMHYPLDFDNTARDAILRCTYSFFLGAVLYQLIRRFKGELGSTVPFLLLAASIASVVFWVGTPRLLLIPPLFAITVAALYKTTEKTWLNRCLSHRVLVYFGTISYSLYMVHVAVWWVLSQALKIILKATIHADVSHAGYLKDVLNPYESTAIILAGMCVVVGVSHFTYRHVEDRFRRGRPALAPAKAAEPAPTE
jgi:peptidoglycan/LPS O-acetylase OafA/YrhL